MSENERKNMAIGLDIGTSRIVLARKSGNGYEFESQLNAFVNVPFANMTAKALEKEAIPFTRKNGDLVVHGNESERFADLLGLETRRPMMGGVLNSSEPESSQVIGKLVDTMLGDMECEGIPLYFSVPAPPVNEHDNLTYHEATLKTVLGERGFDVKSISEGLAVIYGELEQTNFTGIGVSCGGGLCNVCLAYLSVPVLSFSVPKAGDYIDAAAAKVTDDNAMRIRIEKESAFHLNGKFDNQVHQAISIYYDDVIESVVSALKEALSAASALPKFKNPIPLALSGGTALPKGFAKRFEKALGHSKLPVEISEVRAAKDPLVSTAKGALVAAMAEL